MTPTFSKPHKPLTAAAAVAATVLAFGIVRAVSGPTAHADQTPAAKPAATGPLPTILLTGYEPFGKDRPPNASWEGIKPLDGRVWNGHRIVARQAKVVWGQPMAQVAAWVGEVKPVAVFAFGQGGADGFALEVQACNARGKHKDNDKQLPAGPAVVPGGPDKVLASLRFEPYTRALAEKGHPVRVSTNAGRYLCEEMLYTLEHLKAQRLVDGTVLFCHVPPLGKKVQDQVVTPEYVRRFVEDLLAVWHRVDAAPAAPAADPRHAEVKAMVERYFRVWSEQDMRGYDDCFVPDAMVQFIDGRGNMTSTPRNQFVAGQRDYHRTSPVKTVEVPTAIDITFEGPLARAVVAWKLTAGARTETGYDHFTLMRRRDGWRIVNLVFYASPADWGRAAP